jgi:hypothetical protein
MNYFDKRLKVIFFVVHIQIFVDKHNLLIFHCVLISCLETTCLDYF